MILTKDDPFAKIHDVYLDGEKINNWIEADIERGMVKMRDPKGSWNIRHTSTITKYGKVEIHNTHTGTVYR